MKKHPILFSAPMVLALLAGKKTQTRRILKPPYGTMEMFYKPDFTVDWMPIHTKVLKGDRLWVREAWRAEAVYDDTKPSDLERDACQVYYPADNSWSDKDAMTSAGKLRPSMFMPRWASRLTLTVNDVRVERLQDINEEDAWAEGVCAWDESHDKTGWHGLSTEDRQMMVRSTYGDPVNAYRHLWESINGPDSWDENPWVAAYTFDVHKRNIDAMTADVTP